MLLKWKTKPYMSISIDREKTFNKIWHTFMIKTFEKLEVEGTSLILIPGVCEKPTANIIPRTKELKAFS